MLLFLQMFSFTQKTLKTTQTAAVTMPDLYVKLLYMATKKTDKSKETRYAAHT